MITADPRNIVDILTALADGTAGGREVVIFQRRGTRPAKVTGAELLERARRAASGLRRNGVARGDRVLLMLSSQSDFIDAFFGAIWADAIPVPLFPPIFSKQPDDFFTNFGEIANNSGAHALFASEDVMEMTEGFADRLGAGFRVLSFSTCGHGNERLEEAPTRGSADLALLQYTSGSTGLPKGVALSHANVLANVRAIGHAMKVNEHDVGVIWLPLYHDMGLISVLATLGWGGRLVMLSPLDFAKDPSSWLRAISEYGGTLSPAPNFAYRRCLGIADDELAGIDLTSWRAALNGAEPVDATTLNEFTSRFEPYGFHGSAFYPVYGLAEHTLAVCFPTLGQGPRIDTVDRNRLAKSGIAESVPADHPDALSFVSVGTPLDGVSVEVRSRKGKVLKGGHVGEVLIKSSSVMTGYFNNSTATADVLSDGWLKTGDLGYLKDGLLYITGRIKDLIIRAGHNYYPEDIESAAIGVSGVRAGRVAAFSASIESNSEHVVVLVESDLLNEEQQNELMQKVASAVAARVGFRPNRVALFQPGTLPITSSGKVRRRVARERFLNGGLA